MKIIIVGPPGTGKTTLLHKIIRMNTNSYFQFILDGIEHLGVDGQNDMNLPNLPNMIITTQVLENVPNHIRQGALILDVPEIRR